jgi:hypothetical protein
VFRQKGCGDSSKYDASKHRDWKNVVLDFFATRVDTKDNALNLVVDSSTCAKMYGLRVPGQIVKVGLEEPESLG